MTDDDDQSRAFASAISARRMMVGLGIFYFSLGAMAAFLAVARDAGLTKRSAASAAAALAPGVLYLIAVAAGRRYHTAWIVTSLLLTTSSAFALLFLLLFITRATGLIDLAQARNVAATSSVILLGILIAFHARLAFHLVGAWHVGGAEPTARGFDPVRPKWMED